MLILYSVFLALEVVLQIHESAQQSKTAQIKILIIPHSYSVSVLRQND